MPLSSNERGLYDYCKGKSTVWGMASSMLTHCEKKSLEQYQSRKSQNSILHVALKRKGMPGKSIEEEASTKPEGPSASFMQNVLKKAPRTVWLKNKAGMLPLHVACENGVSTSILELLIKVAEEQGTDEDNILNTVDKDYKTPLHHRLLAETSITMADVKLLSGCGSFGEPGAIALADKDGNLPLHILCQKKTKTNIEVLHFMLQLYPQAIEEKNVDGKTPAGLEPSHEIKQELHNLGYWEDLS